MAEQTQAAARAARRAVRRHGALVAPGIVPGGLRPRRDLLRSTALQAVFLAAIAVPATRASAQTPPAATALPTGGQVIAGQATIAATAGAGSAAMTVKQGTAYGAYNWQSYDIGRNASVTYQVPTSQSVSVNRVVAPSPSVIAGKLTSNGVVVITNQSGVVFTQGAEVNVSTLIASAPGISEANARAGKLVFDQAPRPGAKVENHGTITVAQTGLAALVAPQVANSGVIRAQMGRVVLAGAEAHTVDLYGDGLLSIDVTKQVTQVPTGPDGKAATALVTNTGTIIADGGSVLLTASAIDGLVQTLVTSGGTVRTNTAGGTTGRVAVTAKGGNIAISGTIAAAGTAPGSRGGQVEINAPARSVTLKAGARVDVSGKAGGGTAAIGTTIARAKAGPAAKAPTARDVVIESGARVAADATLAGAGGNVTVLSQGGTTVHRGEITARGGTERGNGGFVETSGDTLALGGRVDVTAPAGSPGTILLDPIDLVISGSDTTKGKDAPDTKSDSITTKAGAGTTNLNADDILSLSGNITIEALGTLTISAPVDTSKTATIGDVTFKSGGDMAVNAAVTIDGAKTLALLSGGGIALKADLTAGAIDLTAAGGVVQSAGSLAAGSLLSSGGITGSVVLTSATNKLGTLGAVTVTGGDFALANSVALDVTGALALDAGRTASFAVPGFAISTGSIASAGGTFELAPLAGTMSLGKDSGGELALTQATLDKIGVGTLRLGAAAAGGTTATSVALNDALDTSGAGTTRLVAGAGGVALNAGPLKAGTLDIATAGGGVTDNGAAIIADSLQSTGGIAGAVALDKSLHAIGALGPMTVTGGGLTLIDGVALNIAGNVSLAGDSSLFSLAVSAKAIEVTGTLALSTAGNVLTLASDATGGITLSGVVDTTMGSLLNLVPGSLGATQTAGSVTTGLLISTGGAGGTVKLDQAGNAVGSIGNFAVSGGDFILATGTAVAVTGALSAANVSITGSAPAASAIAVSGSITADGAAGTVTLAATDAGKGGIALSGDVTAAKGAIDLSAGAGGVAQTSGSLTAPSLLSTGGIAGSASLGSATNAIDATGAVKVSGGDLLLATTTALDVTGTLSVDAGRTLALQVNGLKISTGLLSAAGGTVEIAPLDGATMSLGKAAAAELTITAADLAKISSATLRLGGASASATVADSLVVRDAFDATAAATAVLRLDAGANGITIDSAATLKANTLDLNAAGSGVNGIAGALVTANRLQSSAGVAGDVALANSVHGIGTLGDMTVNGTLALATGLALDIAGKVATKGATIGSSAAGSSAIAVTGTLLGDAGATLALTAGSATGGIALSGSLDASSAGVLDLASGSGGILQSAGTVAAGTLTGSTTGSLALAGAANQFPIIGKLTVTGDAKVNSAVATTVAGPVTAANATITGSATGGKAIDVTGTVKATGTALLSALDKAGGIALSGTIDAGIIDLGAGTGGVVQGGGALVGALLRSSGDSGGSVALDAAANKVGALGPFLVGGASDFSLTTATALQVVGAVASGSGNVTLTSTAAGGLDIAAPVSTGKATVALRATNGAGGIKLGGDVDAGGGTIDLVTGSGGVTQTSGVLGAQLLASSAGVGGAVTLGQAGNKFAGIGNITVTAGGLTLVNADSLAVSGTLAAAAGTVLLDATSGAGKALSVGGAISAANVTLIGRGAGGGVAVGGSIATPGALDVSVTGGGGFTAAGDLKAGTLQSSLGIVGGVAATGSNNLIGTLGGIAVTGGDIALATQAGTGTTVAGIVAVEAGRSITLTADSLSITTGALTAPSGTIDITAPTSGISLGAAFAGELAILQTDLVNVTTDTLNLHSTAGAVTLRGNLNTTGAAPGRLGLDAGAGIVLSSGTLTAPTLVVAAAAGGVTQTAGVLAAKDLRSGGSVAGAVTLDNAANTIGTLGLLAATGAVSIASASLMDVTGTVTAPGIALTGGAAGAALSVSGKGALVLTAPGTIALTTSTAGATTSLAGLVDASAAGTLLLAGSGEVVQTAGQIVAGTVTAPASIGGADLGQGANVIVNLGAFAAKGDLTLASTQALTAASTVNAANVTLRSASASAKAITVSSGSFGTLAGGSITLAAGDAASGVALSGTLNATGTGIIDISAGAAGVAQSGGSLTAGTLRSTGGIGGTVSLTQGNDIAGLGKLAAGGAITLVTGQSLAVSAPVSAGAGTTISLAATGMSFTGTSALTAAGGTVEIGPTVGTASFGLGSAGGDFALGSLANVTASHLRIGQASSAGNANTAASIALADAVTPAATTLELISAGAITQSKGGLAVPVLTATAASLDLGRPGNSIGTLGALAVGGDLAIANDLALSVGGALSAANITLSSSAASAKALDVSGTLTTAAGGAITLAAGNAAGGIALSGKLDATASGAIDLSAGTGGITQTGGTLTSGTLRSAGGATGAVLLDQAGNAIGALGDFAVTGAAFTLRDSLALDVTGAVAGSAVTLRSAGPTLSLAASGSLAATGTALLAATDKAGGIVLAGAAKAGTLDLSAGSGGIKQTAGAITAATLQSSGGSSGTVALGQSGNRVATLGVFTVTGADFTLVDAAALTAAGPVSAANVTLRGSAAGAKAIDVTGSIATTAGGTITLAATGATGGLALSGTLDASASGAIDLSAGSNGVAQTAGSLVAATLRSTGGATGDVALTQKANAIATLGDFAVTGAGFSFADSVALSIGGSVQASTIAITDAAAGTAIALAGSLSASGGTVALTASDAKGGISLGGSVTAGNLDLVAGSGISQPGGSIAATTVTASVAAGSATLARAGNSIATLGATTITGGDLVLVDSVPLTVAGTVKAGNITITDSAAGKAVTVTGSLGTGAGGTIALTASNAAGGIDLGGTVNATATGTLDLTAGGDVTQSAGSVTAGTLRSTGGIGGNLSLAQPGNAIGSIAALAVAGNAAIADSIALDVTGTFAANTISVQAGAAGSQALAVSGNASATGTMTLAATAPDGGILLSGTLKATSLDLAFGTGGVIQSAGGVTTQTLTGSGTPGASANLTQGTNSIGALGAFSVPGGILQITDTAALAVVGPVSATNVTLKSSAASAKAIDVVGSLSGGSLFISATAPSGGIALSGTVTASGIGSFTAGSGGVVQTAGTLKANILDAGSTGSVVLTQAGNTVGSLIGAKVTAGDFSLVTATGFTAQGIAADNITLQALSGGIGTGAISIATNGAGTIHLDAVGGVGLGGALTAAGGIVDITTAGGGVTQSATAPITAGTLRSSGGIAGAVQLDKAANSIAAIGDLAAAGIFALADAAALTVSGTLSAMDIAISDSAASAKAIAITGTARSAPGGSITLVAGPGGIALSGTVDATATGVVDLNAGGAGIAQTAGTITAGTLRSSNGIGGSTTLDQAGNAIATLGGMALSAGNLRLASSIPLAVQGPVAISAGNLALAGSAPGTAITVAGPVTVSGTASLAATDPAGGIVLAGAVKASVLDLFAGTGGVTQTGGSVALGTLQASGLNGPVNLAQGANSIATIGAFTVDSGGVALASAIPVTVAGTLKASQGDVTVTGFAAGASAITVGGAVAAGPGKTATLAAPSGGVTVSPGGIVAAPGGLLVIPTATGIAAPGTLAAGKLAVAATKAGDITLSGANAIGTLAGAVLANGGFVLNDTVPLTIAGPVTARLLGITAAGSLKLSDGVVITTDGLSRSDQGVTATLSDAQIAALTTSKLGSYLAVTSAGGAPGKIETGSITVAPFSAAQAVIDLVLPQPEAGTIAIGKFMGTTTDLILVTRTGGIATGTVDVAGLLVVGTGGKTDLFGRIGGVEGQAAANKANISPQPNSDYRFNACPITSVNCVLIPIQTVPPTSPLRDVPLIRERSSQDDTDVQLPNVSDEDY